MKYWIVYLLLLSFGNVYAQPKQHIKDKDSLEYRVVLIGDAGSLVKGKPSVLNSIKKYFALNDKTMILFLGDNLYDYGLPDETYFDYNNIRAALDSQINLVKNSNAKGIMIPGNHDWANGLAMGYDNVVRQQLYVEVNGGGSIDYLPKYGCPGPVEYKLTNNAVLVVIDSQWWLHTKDKPGVESDCDTKTEEEVTSELKEILNKNFDKLVLLAMHHPFKSNGPHGGYYTLKQHIFPFTDLRKNLYIPLPVIGSIYPITRSVFGSHQDISHPAYANMIAKIMTAVKNHPHVIMVSGHEHNLQYIKDSSYNYIVSGSGCKSNRVSPGRKAEFSKEALGFATLDIYKNKTAGIKFYTVDAAAQDSLRNEFSQQIIDFGKLPPVPVEDTVMPVEIYKNIVTTAASSQYKKQNAFKRFINGVNYRKVWSEPVTIPVFNIRKEKGGFSIDGMGGGNQTKSLRLKDKKGDEWVLRTIDKDPDKAIPENFRNTFASEVVQDMISAAQPYAPFVVHELEKAAGLSSAKKEIYYIPNDPALGYYRNVFANKVCLLEKKEANGGDDNKSTFKLLNKMREDNNTTIDQNAVLNTRLLDMLIGDWDRHFDQWRWAPADTGKGKLYYPMPKDRDQAFFYSDGLLIKFMQRKMSFLSGFSYDMNDPAKLNMVSKDFDRIFLNNISKQSWDSVTQSFLQKMPDTVIDYSVKKFPAEIYSLIGKSTSEKLKNRRNQLQEKSTAYYGFLSKEVTITGSNENELYSIQQAPGGNLSVTGYSYKPDRQDSSFITYHRIFNEDETNEIRIFGFNGKDKLIIDSNTHTGIKLRFVGGKGDDTIINHSSIKVVNYDISSENNYVSGRSKKYYSIDPSINDYQLRSYQYPQQSFPKLVFGWNADDHFLIGAGFLFKNFGFKRGDFANQHRFSSLFAIERKAVQLKYNAIFNNIIALKYDILVNASLNMPGITNFFGLGNNTEINKDIPFYRARYKTAGAEILFRKNRKGALSIYAGPIFDHFWNRKENNIGRVLDKPQLIGLDSVLAYKAQSFAGIKAGINIDNLNDPLFPTRGIVWNSSIQSQEPLQQSGSRITKIQSDMTVYASLKIPARVTGVIRLGGAKLYTNNLQFFQAVSLGQNNNLRGFRKNRFAGDAAAYGSLELRVRMVEGKSYLFPGQAGFIMFNDVGRVWLTGEKSSRWHYVYGGGIYYVPFNTAIVSATLGKSGDGLIFNISLGTKFNITF